MGTFEDFKDAVVTGAQALAKELIAGFEAQADADSKAFLARLEADLQRWSKLLATGQLTGRDFADLVQARKALAEMHALTVQGLALLQIERFRTGLINLLIDAAFKTFL